MLAPFDEGLAPYPPPGTDGAGVVGGDAVRLVTDLGRGMGISRFDPDAPLARELQGTPGAVRDLVGHALPRHVRAGAVLARRSPARPLGRRLRRASTGPLSNRPSSSACSGRVHG